MGSQQASSTPFHLRKATPADLPAIEALIALSVRTLHPPFYTATVIDLALTRLEEGHRHHMKDGNFFVVETAAPDVSCSGPSDLVIVGCGGWSQRDYDGEHSLEPVLLDPLTGTAKLRALFVHPEWVRKGIASMLVRAGEDAAREAGFRRVEIRGSLQVL